MLSGKAASKRIVDLFNERNASEIAEIGFGEVEFGGVRGIEKLFALGDVYWHVEESDYISSTPEGVDYEEVHFHVIAFWRSVDPSSQHKVDHYDTHTRFIRWDPSFSTVQETWSEEYTPQTFSIRERRKLKRKAIKFHKKRNRDAKIQEDIQQEGNRWRREGDNVTAEEREAIREKKREYWKQKHQKFEKKAQQKKRVTELSKQLEVQEEEIWGNSHCDSSVKWAMPRVCIDMSFLPLMDDFAIGSVRNQLGTLYNRNLEAIHPFRVYLSSSTDATDFFDALVSKQIGMKRWAGFSMHPGTEVFELLPSPGLPIIYLSPDADETLETVDENHLYVIGGLCDRDRKRNITKGKCDQLGLTSRRLPIDEYMSFNGSKILTINAVFAILCTWMETNSWTESFTNNLRQKSLVGIKKK